MANPEQQVRTLVEQFTDDLMKIVRGAALDSLASALGAVQPGSEQPRLARGTPGRKPAANGRQAAARKAPATKTRRGRTGEKRDPKLLAALTKRVGEHIASHPGQGARQIGAALSASTRELELPIKKLLASGQVRKTGERSETKYFPRAGGAGAKKAAAS
ncbi:MAG TPA: DNA-binding protein [Minicystis sp.]|nr:DNA-binding protein [Minicystis sp.]